MGGPVEVEAGQQRHQDARLPLAAAAFPQRAQEHERDPSHRHEGKDEVDDDAEVRVVRRLNMSATMRGNPNAVLMAATAMPKRLTGLRRRLGGRGGVSCAIA